jgi:zinc protease
MVIQRSISLLLACLLSCVARAQEWRPITTQTKLSNGLTVVLSEDHSAPTVGLCLSYGIGSRLEPQGRSGFAHLFEHMMFEGTPAAPKGIFERVLESGGGVNNAETDSDFTQYYESAPVSALDAMLWLEADRMKTLDFSSKNLDNQRSVVQEEVRVSVLNQPYGLFYFVDLPAMAFDRFPNSHNGFGNFKDLDAASIEDVRHFYELYYAPNNAVLAIVGDFSTDQLLAKIQKYFSTVPSRPTPRHPDVSEDPQTAERRLTQSDRLAKVPALAIGYRMPPRTSREAVVGALVGELLHNGQASRLYRKLVKESQVAISVAGGLNFTGTNPFEYNGPTLLTSFIVYPKDRTQEQVLQAYDAIIADLAARRPPDEELNRIRAKMRSDWYAQLEIPLTRAQVLSHATLLDGSFGRAYAIPEEVSRVTSEEVRAFVAKYLSRTNRTIINRVPERAKTSDAAGDPK